VKAHPQRSEARRPKTAKVAGRARPELGTKVANSAAKATSKPSKTAPVHSKSVATKDATPAMNAAKLPAAKRAAAKPAAAKLPAANPSKPAPLKVAKPLPTKPAAVKALAPAALKGSTTKAAAKPVVAKPAPVTPASKPGKAAKAAVVPPLAPVAAPKKPARKSIKEAAGVSTDAVARRTGKNWDGWFEVLDTAGAATLDQRGIIAILAQKHGIGPWWQQMIAVGYESLRAKSDKPPVVDGFQINSSCTLDAPLPRVFRLWNDAGERARWLADDRFVVRGATGDKLIRARWGKGTSHVAVSFTEKSGRTEVSVEHHQIESRGAAEHMKAYWEKKLGLLDQALAPRR
jgi:uncharacterized protein YndB with AHSA1/START domain